MSFVSTRDMDVVIDSLLTSQIEPCWTTFPKTIKRALCKRAFLSFDSVHTKNFSERLHDIWSRMRNYRLQKDAESSKIECAICMKSYSLNSDDKVTTLLCGHQFCSSCIFQHIYTRGFTSACPMCRRMILQQDDPQHEEEKEEDEEEERIDPKILRRRLERFKKRQNKKLSRSTLQL